jgi:uncharacterized membrane protein
MKKSLSVIIGLAFLSRMLFLGGRQLGIDELLQALIVRAPTVPDFLVQLRHAIFIASPLDMLAQKSLTFALGDSAWALRLHAVVFGTLSIWVFARIARMLFNERAALYSTVLFAVFPLQYHYSQEGRPYSLLVLLTLVSYDLLLRIDRRDEVRKLDWLQLGVVLLALLYTSILALAVLTAQFVGLIMVRVLRQSGQAAERESNGAKWRNLFIYIGIACIAFALFIPWLRYGWIRTAGAGIFYPGFLLRLFKELGDNSYAMTGLILTGVVAGFRAMRRHNASTSLIWLVSWFSGVTLAVLVLKLVMRYPFAIADVLAATPPLMLMAGYGLSHVGERLTILPKMPYQLSAPAFVYAALMVLGSAWIAQSHWKREPVDWAGTAVLLQGTAREGDAVAMPKIYHLIEYYSPNLAAFRSSEIDPGPGSLSTGASQRRVVVCYNNMRPDPCSGFRQKAQDDKTWRKLQLRGLSVFIRQEK